MVTISKKWAPQGPKAEVPNLLKLLVPEVGLPSIHPGNFILTALLYAPCAIRAFEYANLFMNDTKIFK